ncbi:class I SAM-dependent methyltransferase [Phyllobacterium meliloti]|uniref:class I SAM-dependent methyltransferase n=1 Tax=Phyllobacterium meliloti TaxID=555317 RepID=UPI001D13F3BF|nr:class I SAM-dependent methyltransferase [Phyllobacterium sp. T1293]UGX85541.1 class I SAM-dependent methyltransferase [Phyllobacterium sp. T1293]
MKTPNSDASTCVVKNSSREDRSLDFRERSHKRYWWFRVSGTNYVPPVFASLSDEEWSLIEAWYEDTERKFENPGEIGISGFSILAGLISGNGISSIVQCGHYVGFSTLLLAFLLRKMGKPNSIFSIDIDPRVTEYTADWLRRAELEEYVELHVGNSSSIEAKNAACSWLQNSPELIFIDSSHQFSHTLEELDLWYGELKPGGFLCLHDTSIFAQTFDTTGRGGVLAAADKWIDDRQIPAILINRFVDGTQPIDNLTYRDGCGFGIIQKPWQ